MKAAAIAAVMLLMGSSPSASAHQPRPQELIDAQADAKRLLDEAGGTCSLAGIAKLEELLRLYGNRPEPALRLLSAQARFKAGNTTWFRERRREAQTWFQSVIRLYGDDEALPLQRLVAQSNYTLARTVKDRRSRARYLDRVISRYAATDDLDLLQTYGSAMFAKADLVREAGRDAEAAELNRQAQQLYRARIIPRLPKAPETEEVCV